LNQPKTELREYLNILIHRFLNCKSLYSELLHISAWKTSKERIGAINLSGSFFQMANYSMTRIYLVELASLLSKKEDRSLFDWLKKAHTHAKSMEPSRYSNNNEIRDRETINPYEYQKTIDEHIFQLESHSETIDRIKALRDKLFVHLDKTYFENPGSALEAFPVKPVEIGEMIETVSGILKCHYSYLFKADLKMELIIPGNVDVVLTYALAFQRIRTDQALIKSGFRPAKYMGKL
jgi:hypothetical protein